MLLNNKDIGLLGLSLLNSSQGGASNPGLGLLSALQYVIGQQPQAEQYNPFPRMSNQTQPTELEGIPMAAKSQIDMQQLKTAAQNAWPNNPLMQRVALTQAILESGLQDGKPSALASNYYNLFGIKGAGSAGSVGLPTTEYVNGQPQKIVDKFARNASYDDSFGQHRNLINKKRYAPVLAATNPYDAFVALQQSGYATDPRYPDKLNSVYSKYVAPLFDT